LISRKSEYDLIEQSVYDLIKLNNNISLGEIVYLFTNEESEICLTDEESIIFLLSDMYNKDLIKYETTENEEEGLIYTKLMINVWDKDFAGENWYV